MNSSSPARQRFLRRLEVALFAIAGLTLQCWFVGTFGGRLLPQLAERAPWRESGRAPRGPVPPRTPEPAGQEAQSAEPSFGGFPGIECLGRIEIPRIGLSTPIVEGTGTVPLLCGVGHLTGSTPPGGEGNVVLAGHRDTHFRSLGKVREADLIRVVTPERVMFYRVDSISIVNRSEVDILREHSDSRLTLVTCYPFLWLGPAPKRFIVVARPISSSPTPSV